MQANRTIFITCTVPLHMDEVPDIKVVKDAIEPIVMNQLESIKGNFPQPTDIETNYTGGEYKWSFAVAQNGHTVRIMFKLVDSSSYEEEQLGYNIILESVQDDGRILTKYCPHNYTNDVWTADITELERRARKVPQLEPTDL